MVLPRKTLMGGNIYLDWMLGMMHKTFLPNEGLLCVKPI